MQIYTLEKYAISKKILEFTLYCLSFLKLPTLDISNLTTYHDSSNHIENRDFYLPDNCSCDTVEHRVRLGQGIIVGGL